MESIWINGKDIHLKDYTGDHTKISCLSSFEREIITFINEWIKGKEIFKLLTSGSTGPPKTISIHRKQMINSAEKTLDYLNIKKGGNALLCLNPKYIAGRMMIVRSLIGNLNLFAISPVSNPLLIDNLDYTFDLVALVPYQVTNILDHDRSTLRLKSIKNVLIGGAELPEGISTELKSFGNQIFQTFGMTETISHIALKKLSGETISGFYEVLEGIDIGLDDRGCLTVLGDITAGRKIITNDLVTWVDKRKFIWRGRIDQVINSGGIKLNIMEVENKIKQLFISENITYGIFVSGIPDLRLGERMILIVETLEEKIEIKKIKTIFSTGLSKYERPREIHPIKKFLYTETGKINRSATLKLLTLH